MATALGSSLLAPTDAAITAAVTTAAATVATAGAAGALVVAAWLRHEVPVGSPEQGDRNPHNGNTCCWPGDIPLHDIPSDCKQCIGQELAAGPAAAVAVGDAAEKSDLYSGLW